MLNQYNRTSHLEVVPTLTLGAYVDLTVVGGLLSFSNNGRGGVIRQIILCDHSKLNANLDLYLFSRKPTSPLITDRDVKTLVNNEGHYEIARHQFLSTDYRVEGGYSVVNAQGLDYSWQQSLGTLGGLYGLLVLNGSTPSYSLEDLYVKLVTWVD